ncbi:MAG: TonB-dependent receptor [Novosphingobium sp. 32-60-15]|uniref:TonB-dependent receptor n=1 Tax=unclassified Novosphingobium TaxID=2644732 RepID=UPI000BD78A39|nr:MULTISPECIES: TonB-dependent receptor [unclassified Novosphingobium]OYX61923.1 MAG: TonB-dependent receptor [Novosphingobium sp. 32-60-15]
MKLARLLASGTAVAALALAVPAFANDGAAEDGDQSSSHSQPSTEIIVTAPYARDRDMVATAVTVLQGDALQLQQRSTIGETLARQPGVSSSFFGPNASRPILRGLDNERVRVLTDGIGSFDVSNTSVDHAVAINPLLADRIEILRGPAALLYGSGAIGGVVNMRDLRIPREVPEGGPHVDAVAGYASAAHERNIGASVNAPLGGGFVAHVDGSFFESDDYRSGGFIFSRSQRDAAVEEGGELAEDASAFGRVDNTAARTWDVAGGLAWIGQDGANFGLAVSHLTNRYGIPNGLDIGHEEELTNDEGHGHADIMLDMRQNRVDLRGAVPLNGAFKELKVRAGWADYRHNEIESTGEIGTRFFNRSWEARAELVQANRGGWQGATGMQVFSRNFSAVGEEAYIPANQTRQFGLFTLQEFDLGNLRLEASGRYEHSTVKSAPVGRERRFDAVSLSVGGSVKLAEGWRLALSLARAERAPAAEELFANGAHAATRAFEVGNPGFGIERQLGAEAVLRGRGEGWRLELSGFFNRFDNFISLNASGDEADGLPVFQYAQTDARFYGFEVEGAVTLAQLGRTRVEATGLVDYTRADILGGGGAVPRIPPLRLIGGLEAAGDVVGGRLEVEHATAQRRIAAFETTTPAWTMVNASVSWKPFGADAQTTLLLQANNIFDVEARRHTSFLKDVAPLFGRDIRVSARVSF